MDFPSNCFHVDVWCFDVEVSCRRSVLTFLWLEVAHSRAIMLTALPELRDCDNRSPYYSVRPAQTRQEKFATDMKPRQPGLIDYILPFLPLPLAGIGIGLAAGLAAAFFGIGLVWFRLLTVE